MRTLTATTILISAIIIVLGIYTTYTPPEPQMATKKMLDPKTFPRPPLLEKITKHLLVKWPASMGGQTIAETRAAYWVLETFHPPTYYIPPSDILAPLTRTPKKTFCEWKGTASYFSLPKPDGTGNVENRAWCYERPDAERFKPIEGFVSFYNGPWECFVDGERVVAQPGDFYGGWVTSEIRMESVKGAPGTRHW